MKLDRDMMILAAGAVVLGGAVWWLTRPGRAANLGASMGGAAVDLITGTVSGAADATVKAANDPSINPLQPLGSWIGGAIYDYTHSKANGGVW